MAATAEALMNTLAGGGDGASDSQALDSSGADGNGGDASNEASSGIGAAGGGAAAAPAGSGGVGSEGDAAATEPAVSAKPTAEQLYQQAMAANRETRAENKTLKQQLAELTAKIDSLAKPAPAKEEPPAEPDFLADPKGYVDDTRKQIKDLTAKLESKEKEQTEAQQKQQQAQETWNKVIASEQEFAAATPDYYDAINHVRGIRAEQIKVEIRETEEREPTAEEIGRILSIQEAQGAAALIAKGKNPSKFYYEYAKTFGYKPNSATAQPNSVSGRPNSPTAVAVSARPDKDAVRTMGSGGGAEHVAADEPEGALGILAAAQNEHKAQFKRRK